MGGLAGRWIWPSSRPLVSGAGARTGKEGPCKASRGRSPQGWGLAVSQMGGPASDRKTRQTAGARLHGSEWGPDGQWPWDRESSLALGTSLPSFLAAGSRALTLSTLAATVVPSLCPSPRLSSPPLAQSCPEEGPGLSTPSEEGQLSTGARVGELALLRRW